MFQRFWLARFFGIFCVKVIRRDNLWYVMYWLRELAHCISYIVVYCILCFCEAWCFSRKRFESMNASHGVAQISNNRNLTLWSGWSGCWLLEIVVEKFKNGSISSQATYLSLKIGLLIQIFDWSFATNQQRSFPAFAWE